MKKAWLRPRVELSPNFLPRNSLAEIDLSQLSTTIKGFSQSSMNIGGQIFKFPSSSPCLLSRQPPTFHILQ